MRQAFLDGAFFICGHTIMQRALGRGYQSPWARTNLPLRRDRNGFYTTVGRLAPAGQAGLERLKRLATVTSPGDLLAQLEKL